MIGCQKQEKIEKRVAKIAVLISGSTRFFFFCGEH